MIIAITNQKGGVAKTTTAQALGAGLNLKGYKVLLIDLDPQANLTHAVVVHPPDIESVASASVLDVLTGKISLPEGIICQPYNGDDNEDILPATTELAAVEKILKDTGREFKLREALEKAFEKVRDAYDYIIIDTPPSLGILTVNALTAADKVIIPAQADDFSLQGISELYNTICSIRRYTNPRLRIDGILLTRYNPRSVISRDMAEAMRDAAERIEGKLYKTHIRECTALKEAQAMHRDIFSYAPRSNAAVDYMAFIDEVLEGIEDNTHRVISDLV
jgi:chromosome partitioning protein